MMRVLHHRGSEAIASGGAALAAFKGGKLHRRSGMIFVPWLPWHGSLQG
jgi:hypothetical protein